MEGEIPRFIEVVTGDYTFKVLGHGFIISFIMPNIFYVEVEKEGTLLLKFVDTLFFQSFQNFILFFRVLIRLNIKN